MTPRSTTLNLALLCTVSVSLCAVGAYAKGSKKKQPPPPAVIAELQGVALRIDGVADVGSDTVFAAGTLVTPVSLRTEDPDDGAITVGGSLMSYSDGINLSTGEAVDVYADEQLITRSGPTLYRVQFETDQGAIPGAVFSDGADAYFLPRTESPVADVDHLVADSTVRGNPVDSLSTYNYSLLPIGSHAIPGFAFEQYSQLGTSFGGGVRPYVVYDADGVRGTTDSLGEELLLTVYPGSDGSPYLGGYTRLKETEILAQVRFIQGDTGAVLGVYHYSQGFYGAVTQTFVFDEAGLAALGHGIEDVAGVTGLTGVNHDLTWAQLGFAD